MVYFGWYLVNPHVQVVQNMFGKGGYRGFKAKVQAPKVDPQNTKTENAVLKKVNSKILEVTFLFNTS